jgi:hypothetical protein
LAEFWRNCDGARLFEDKKYGQWGLILLSPSLAAERSRQLHDERPREFMKGDLVVGEFLGDSDLLVVRCDPKAGDFGSVLVVLPLDPRDAWVRVSSGFEFFLEDYERAEGAKFWERN